MEGGTVQTFGPFPAAVDQSTHAIPAGSPPTPAGPWTEPELAGQVVPHAAPPVCSGSPRAPSQGSLERRVPSIFRSSSEADRQLRRSAYGLDVFGGAATGAPRVRDDTSAFELQCVARLRTREAMLQQLVVEDGWRLQRAAAREADELLQGFDQWRPLARPTRPCCGHTARHYLRELLAANPGGYLAAVESLQLASASACGANAACCATPPWRAASPVTWQHWGR
mmetsp:Transcript_8477/g.27007  ORF Transcript_8477/g.27007 Transcript_8477/m.27007 type:complete len:225 (-) Transcript_8477:26-700(-)